MFLLSNSHGISRAFDEMCELKPSSYHLGSRSVVFLTDNNELFVTYIENRQHQIIFRPLTAHLIINHESILDIVVRHQHSLMYLIKEQLDEDGWYELACRDVDLLSHHDNVEELSSDFWVRLHQNTSRDQYYKLKKHGFDTWVFKAELEND